MDEKKQVTAEIVDTGRIIIEIIKADLTGGEYSLPVNCDYKKLFKLCEKHKVTYLAAEAVLKDEKAPQQAKSVFQKELFKGNMRYAAQEKEREELSSVFKEKGIEYCFLKGYKLARLYKEPEKRYMLDMDVYIRKERFDEAEEIIKSRGYTLNTFADDKDVGYIKPPFLNIELHKELKYDYDKGYEYYKGAFERLVRDDDNFELDMTNEDFYVYIVSHCAHHFGSGGTGIRNILDHYYLREKLMPLCDKGELKRALEETGLDVFDEKLTKLSDFWFKDTESSQDLCEMTDYVILSGVFGNEINAHLGEILLKKAPKSKLGYILNRLFPPLSQMKNRYKILCKYPILLPIYWGVRLVTFTTSKGDAGAEIKVVNSINEEDTMRFENFMKKNGLF